MRILYTLTLLLSFVTIYSKDLSYKEQLDSAFNFYKKADYKKALEYYHKIEADGYTSAYMYYNMANAYFRLNKISKAILYYERAKLLKPNDPDIIHNLNYVNTFVSDKIKELPEPFFITWFNSLINIFSVNTWAIIALVLFIILAVLVYLYYLFTNETLVKLLKIIAIFVFIIWIISIISAYSSYKHISTSNYAIITADIVEVKSSPDENSTSLFILHEGTKVQITEEFENWFEIKIADGNTGWVKTTNVEKI
jgi:tetratricopeptide (TPR) repeat protein